MRFESIKILNYRQYKDISFDFTKTTNNDLHIIVASNGVGKTNLLNAINWCLYGDEPHRSGASDSKKDTLPICNLKSIEEAKSNGLKTCDVIVEIIAYNNGKRYTIKRSSKFDVNAKISTGKDIFNVKFKDKKGNTNIEEGDHAKYIVDRYLPRKIREYFYFDGEQLLNYFNEDNNKISHIKDSIYEISQVNVIDKTEKHLNEFKSRYSKEISKLSPQLNEKLKEKEKIENSIKSFKEEIHKLEEQNKEAKEAIEKANRILNGTESVVEDNKHYEENKRKIANREHRLNSLNEELSNLVKKYMTKICLYKRKNEVIDYISKLEKSSGIPNYINIDIIKKSLNEHKCRICRNEIDSSLEDRLKKLIEQNKEIDDNIKNLSRIKRYIERNLDLDIDRYEEEKLEIYEKLDECNNEIKALNDSNDILRKRIATVSDLEVITDELNRKRENEKRMSTNDRKIGAKENEIINLGKKLKLAEDSYEKALKANKECEELKSKLEFVTVASKIISEVKHEIIRDVRVNMEKLTMSTFDDLIWKKDTYGNVELDSNFRLKLFHKYEKTSCLNSCSAAEKELLALAFTIALHKVSGYDNLLFIDTPVGRVSDVNRENFAKVLLGISEGKQIILAFTPAEYSDEIETVFNRDVISSYAYLETDETKTGMEVI
ncbi:hypothetical protein EXD82_03150 [Peptacetobacter hominis]|uniref:Nuclease SbcCD subunit C n=1 Tax=Peptacetobacter hominis TaxID=2743610 RepID=A0A544QWN2_9FIRM|nr:AAA family ATPase [Peptacetobacter hominis]TQQ85107.1 hypothetical protein EXD82_03150 [Peptacetobacter hominis]